MPNWKIKKFDDLSPKEIHELYQLRSQVFVVEQQCVYLDQDGKDLSAEHVLGYSDDDQQLLAYGRIMFPTDDRQPVRFGRVVVHPTHRGKGLANQLLKSILLYIDNHPASKNKNIEIAAQSYLVSFYKKFGFIVAGRRHDEDGISHIKMARLAKEKPYMFRSSHASLFQQEKENNNVLNILSRKRKLCLV